MLNNTIHFSLTDHINYNLIYQLFEQFRQTGQQFYTRQFCGQIVDFSIFCEELQKISNLKKVFDQKNEDDLTIHYLSDHNFISVYTADNKKITVDLTTDKKDFLEKMSNFFVVCFQKIEDKKQIHMICPDEYTEKQSIHPMGDVSETLVRSNYSDDVIEKTDFVIKEFNSQNPAGRMVLIDGAPGGGKSFLIRGILKELNNSTCVLVPVSMLESLDKPALIPLLLKNNRGDTLSEVINPKEIKKRPIVLIVEDADSVIVPRSSDNMSAISSILNYTDGIFGSLFDLRIIATTNASHMEIEKALLRPGRLLKRIHVDLLTPEKAQQVYERLTGTKRKFEKHISLAAVYSLSKGIEIDDASGEEHQSIVGF